MLTVVGDTTVDILVRGLPGLPQLNGKSASHATLVQTQERVVPTLGGNGARAAYVAAALGELVRIWSAVGGDSFGELALNWLEGRKVDTASVRIMGEAGTSTNVVLIGEAHGQQTLHYPGASGLFAPRARAVSGGMADWLLIAGYTRLPGWRGDNTLEVLRNAHKNHINTALDLRDTTGKPLTTSEIEPMLPHCTLLLADASELEQITNQSKPEAARWALQAGAGVVIMRSGDQGAWIFDEEASDGLQVPAFPTNVASNTGFSDSFNAAFIFERGRGASMEQSARFANATSALVTSAPRGVLDAPNEPAVRDFLERNA